MAVNPLMSLLMGSSVNTGGGQLPPELAAMLNEEEGYQQTNTPITITPSGDPLNGGIASTYEDPNTIVVEGQGRTPFDPYTDVDVQGADAPFMGNENYLQEALYSLDQAPERKGMFGTKGTLRDILGVVGDAFLMQSGNDPLYRPQRQREQQGDALTGFTDSPEMAMAAIERLAAAGETQLAQQLYSQVQAGQAKQQELAFKQQEAQRAGAKDSQSAYDKGNQVFGRMIGALEDNPQEYARLRPQLQYVNDLYGLGYEIPAEYSPSLAQVYRQGGMPVNQQYSTEQGQARVEQGQQRVGIAQQNADTARINANRPRPAPRPRAQTELEYFQQVSAKPESSRTKGEKAFYDKYTRSGSGSKKYAPPPLPPGFK